MSLKRLTTDAVKRILDALHPRFLGRDQDHLVALADETADDVYTQVQDYVQPLYDFRNDIESTAGAGLVGVADAGGYYTGVTVENVLQELPSLFYGAGTLIPWGSISGKPTTLAGYGITDAAPLSHVGAGGAAHADVVAGGASGFMTGADKTKLNGIATGATANTGTVTSVAVANATGITWAGSPITSSGTLTPTLSANLQAWSGLATSSKQDASANLTSWSSITPSTKADDSSVMHLTGTESASGTKNFTGTLQYSGIEVGYRDVPRVTGGIERGKMFATAAGVTINTDAAGSIYSIYNGSAAAITLTPGAGVTMRLAGTATTGARTLAQRGVATLWFNSSTEVIVTGNIT